MQFQLKIPAGFLKVKYFRKLMKPIESSNSNLQQKNKRGRLVLPDTVMYSRENCSVLARIYNSNATEQVFPKQIYLQETVNDKTHYNHTDRIYYPLNVL